MTQIVAATKEQKSAVKAIQSINTEQFATVVFEPFSERLNSAIAETADLQRCAHDLTVTANLEAFKKARALFRDIRIEGEKKRKETKDPFIAIGKLLDAKNNALEAAVTPHEAYFDSKIKEEEQRKEAAKAELIRKEAEREAALELKINAIKEAPLRAINMSAAETDELALELETIVPTAEYYAERTVEAEILLESTVAQLRQMSAGKLAQEKLAEQTKTAAIEAERVGNIRNSIAGIKNYIIDAADIEKSIELTALIENVKTIQISKEIYGEFYDEAEATKASVIKSLERQLGALKYAELQAQEAINNRPANDSEADQRAKPPVSEPTTESEPVTAVAQNQSNPPITQSRINHIPAATKMAPTALQLVQIVAAGLGVDEMLAHKYLIEADFLNMQFKEAA